MLDYIYKMTYNKHICEIKCSLRLPAGQMLAKCNGVSGDFINMTSLHSLVMMYNTALILIYLIHKTTFQITHL